MRLHIFSDLHVDVAPMKPITVAPDIDAVIVAGDVCQGAEDGFAAAAVGLLVGSHAHSTSLIVRKGIAGHTDSPRPAQRHPSQAPSRYGSPAAKAGIASIMTIA